MALLAGGMQCQGPAHYSYCVPSEGPHCAVSLPWGTSCLALNPGGHPQTSASNCCRLTAVALSGTVHWRGYTCIGLGVLSEDKYLLSPGAVSWCGFHVVGCPGPAWCLQGSRFSRFGETGVRAAVGVTLLSLHLQAMAGLPLARAFAP